MLGSETWEIIYLRAQERASSFLHFPFYHPQTMLLPQESDSKGTFIAVSTYYADEKLAFITMHTLKK